MDFSAGMVDLLTRDVAATARGIEATETESIKIGEPDFREYFMGRSGEIIAWSRSNLVELEEQLSRFRSIDQRAGFAIRCQH